MTKLSTLKPLPFSFRRSLASKYITTLQSANAPSFLSLFPTLLGALIIFILSIYNNQAVQHLNTMILDVAAPIVHSATQPFVVLTSWNNLLHTHKSLREEVALLREQNERYLSVIQTLRQQAIDHQELEKLTKIVPSPKTDYISARVVGRISDGVNAAFMIKATNADGISKNQVVVTADGVLGRVSDVGGISATTARVMPLTDLSSRIPVEIETSHDHGIIAGRNGPELRLIHLEKAARVKVGDRLITSGYGGIFPRGLPVAVVTHVTDDMIKARPLVKESPAFVTVLFGL